MPYVIVPTTDNKFMVKNKITGRIHAYHTTLANARKQIELMGMSDRRKHAKFV